VSKIGREHVEHHANDFKVWKKCRWQLCTVRTNVPKVIFPKVISPKLFPKIYQRFTGKLQGDSRLRRMVERIEKQMSYVKVWPLLRPSQCDTCGFIHTNPVNMNPTPIFVCVSLRLKEKSIKPQTTADKRDRQKRKDKGRYFFRPSRQKKRTILSA